MDYGIKLGDIFYENTDGILGFFQVVGLKAKKQVVLKEIESEIDDKSSTDGGQTYDVHPIKDKFRLDSRYTPNDETITKTVFRKGEDSYYNGTLYVSIKTPDSSCYRNDYFLWEGEELKNNYWVWFQ